VSVAPATGAHVYVASPEASEMSVVLAEVSVGFGTEAHVMVVSAAPAESDVVTAEASITSGAVAHMSVISATAPEVSVVMAEVSVASVAVAHASVVSAVPEPSVAVPETSAAVPDPSVVVAEVSDVTVGAVTSDDAGEAASLDIESADVAEASETDGGGSSARAVPAKMDAPRSAASMASVQPTNDGPRLPSKRGG
jgi:Ni,Fe-hydrogenase III small subunit